MDPKLEVFSAGTNPAPCISSRAIQVMKEIGIDISSGFPKTIDRFTGDPFDYVITVCDHAKEACPIFTGTVGSRLHIGFDDPAMADGSEEAVLQVYRRVRDEIQNEFGKFYKTAVLHDSKS